MSKRSEKMNRDSLGDNIRGICIFLVVFGHFLQIGLRDNLLIYRCIWLGIYTFHVPTLMFLSGVFSSSDKKARIRGTIKLIEMYILMELIVEGARACAGMQSKLNLMYPSFAVWFLLVIIVYRIIHPILKCRYALPVSILLSLISGFFTFNLSFMSVGRLCTMMPFYVLGIHAKERYGSLINLRALFCKNKLRKYFSVIVSFLGLLLFVYIIIVQDYPNDVVWNKSSFYRMGISNGMGILMRLLYSIIALSIIVSLIMIIPQKKNKFSYIGTNSISVYILHTVAYYIIAELDLIPQRLLGGGVAFLLSLITCLFLALPVITRIIQLPYTITELLFKGDGKP